MKRFLSAMLSLAMMATLSTAVFAADTEHTANQVWNTDGKVNTASSKIMTEVIKAEDILVATVPMQLPVVLDTRGAITVPTDAKIINNSDKAIQITNLYISISNGYLAIDEAGVKRAEDNNDQNHYWMYRVNGDTVTRGANAQYGYDTGVSQNSDYALTTSKWKIEKESELPLQFDVKVNSDAYKSAVSSYQSGYFRFTIAYAE